MNVLFAGVVIGFVVGALFVLAVQWWNARTR